MAKMLDNCMYDKVKLLHNLSCALWFLEKHGMGEEKAAGHTPCVELYQDMIKDLEKHVEKLKKTICMLCKE